MTGHFDAFVSEAEHEPDSAPESEASPLVVTRSLPGDEVSDTSTHRPSSAGAKAASPKAPELNIGEVVIFDYGVAVFLGFDESSERLILDDLFSVGLPLILPCY